MEQQPTNRDTTAAAHFVLVPLLAQGHMIPMIDMAKLIAQHGATVSLVTTPHNAARFAGTIHRARSSTGAKIHLVEIPFPCRQVGLPPGCENLDSVPSRDLLRNFFYGLDSLQKPLEDYLRQCRHPPSCIISDKCLSWTSQTAKRFRVPRLIFHGMGCFSLLSAVKVKLHQPHLSVKSDNEPFWVPEMPLKFAITRAQLPGSFVKLPDLDDVRDQMQEAEATAYGVVINTCDGFERVCLEEYRRVMDKKVWCIGPLSLCNKTDVDKFERGARASIGERECKGWLDERSLNSVIYACLGSQCRLIPAQLVEIGLALEASGHPFIWVIKKSERFDEVEKWLREENFEERNKGRGLVIKGWAPQVFLLSHPAIRGFLTHCGWNSVLEGVCSSMPMLTWPMFAEQFFNEKLVVDILGIGVRVGVELPVRWGEEERVGVIVRREEIVSAVRRLMDGEEAEERRNKAAQLGEVARTAMEEGGTSQLNMATLIQDIMREFNVT